MRSACILYTCWFMMFKSGQTSTFKESWSNVSGGPAGSHTGLFSCCVFVLCSIEWMFLFEKALSPRETVCATVFLLSDQACSTLWSEMVWECVGVGRCVPFCPWEATIFPVLWADTDVCFRHFLVFLFKDRHWVLAFPGRYYFCVEDLAPSESVVFEKDPANQGMKTQ